MAGDAIRFVRRVQPDAERVEAIETDWLIVRMQSGDPGAFGELYERHFDRVYTYLRIALGDPHGAEDAAQEIFTQALCSLPSYEIRGAPFTAWLFRVVRHQTIRALERRGREDIEDTETIAQRRENGEHRFDDAVLNRLSDTDLLVFIQRLPVLQRQVILLRYMLDLSSPEIAEILGRSPGSIRQAQLRALEFLRTRLHVLGNRPDSVVPRRHMRTVWKHAPVLRHRRWALAAGPNPSRQPR